MGLLQRMFRRDRLAEMAGRAVDRFERGDFDGVLAILREHRGVIARWNERRFCRRLRRLRKRNPTRFRAFRARLLEERIDGARAWIEAIEAADG